MSKISHLSGVLNFKGKGKILITRIFNEFTPNIYSSFMVIGFTFGKNKETHCQKTCHLTSLAKFIKLTNEDY